MLKTLKLDDYLGYDINAVARKARVLAEDKKTLVEFDFNGIRCLMSADTNPELLVRDYMNARLMEWKTVGPDCVEQYDDDTQRQLEMKKQEHEDKQRKAEQEQRQKDEAARKAFAKRVAGVKLAIVDPEGYDEWKSKNNDGGYGAAVFEYAEGWAKLMQKEIESGTPIEICASETSHELGFIGITGFMHGMAVTILSKHWRHGEQLRKWHNKEYKHEGEGVVNPAILTIG